MAQIVRVYEYVGEDNKWVKTTSTGLKAIFHAEGTFRYPMDLLNPVIELDLSNVTMDDLEGTAIHDCTDLLDSYMVNFAYLNPPVDRQYFITKMEAINSRVIRLYLKEDVLYCASSSGISAFVTRNESNYDPLLEDRLRPLQYKKQVTTETLNDLDPRCTPFSINRSDVSDTAECIAVTIMVDKEGAQKIWDDLHDRYPDNYPVLMDYNILFRREAVPGLTNSDPYIDTPELKVENINADRSYITYLLTRAEYAHLITAIAGNDTLASYIVGAIELPFDKATDFGKYACVSGTTTPVTHRLVVGNTEIKNAYNQTMNCWVNAYGSSSKYIINAIDEDPLITPGSFLDLEPYSQYELYIPLYGWLSVSADILKSGGYLLYYTIDLVTGEGTAYFKTTTGLDPHYTVQCQIGTRLSLNTTNAKEIENQKIALSTKTALGAISAIASIGIGVATYNPVAIAGGVLSGAKTIGDAVTTNLTLLSQGRVNYDAKLSQWYTFNAPTLKVTRTLPTFTDTSTEFGKYAHEYGLPLNQPKDLSTLVGTGFTQVDGVTFTGNPLMKEEKDELISLLRRGVYL